jgi:hypothetical protein
MTRPTDATDTAFVAAGGRLTDPMASGRAHGCLGGLWVRWQWDCYDLGDAAEDGEWRGWRKDWRDFEAPCTAEGWRAWREAVEAQRAAVSGEVTHVG